MASEDDRESVIIHYRIPAELHARMKAAAARKGQPIRTWLMWAIEAEAERQEADDQRRRGR